MTGGAVKRELRVVLRTIILLLFACFVASQTSPLVAQASPDGKDENKAKEDVKHDTPGLTIKPGGTVHMDVDLALVNVTVTDPYNRLVTGLDTDNFRVFEDNVEQELVTFSAEDVPYRLA